MINERPEKPALKSIIVTPEQLSELAMHLEILRSGVTLLTNDLQKLFNRAKERGDE